MALPCLDALEGAGVEIPLVVSQPDRPVGRSKTPQPPPVKQWAEERGISVYQPASVRNRAFRERLEAEQPDALIVVAFGRILGKRTLDCTRFGAINVHYSLLPRYRGAAPVQWTLAKGDAQAGVTTMRMTPPLDAGPILLQRAIDVEPGEHAPSLSRRLAVLGGGLLVETLRELNADSIDALEQNDSDATFAPPLSKVDGWVDPCGVATEIARRVRGFDPWPGVWLLNPQGKRLRLRSVGLTADLSPDLDALVAEVSDRAPGTVSVIEKSRLVLHGADGSALEILEAQPEGKRAMCAADLVHGRQLKDGEALCQIQKS